MNACRELVLACISVKRSKEAGIAIEGLLKPFKRSCTAARGGWRKVICPFQLYREVECPRNDMD